MNLAAADGRGCGCTSTREAAAQLQLITALNYSFWLNKLWFAFVSFCTCLPATWEQTIVQFQLPAPVWRLQEVLLRPRGVVVVL